MSLKLAQIQQNKLSWPDRDRLKTYCFQTLLLLCIFVVVYGSANHHAILQTQVYHLWLPFELNIPLIPEFILIYCSINLVTILPLFTLTSRKIKRMGYSFAASFLMAGIVFYFFPAPVGFTRGLQPANFSEIFRWLYILDESTNTFPSLHICLSYLTVRILAEDWHRLRFLWIWFFLICLSVLFTHQHHLIDILGGFILAEFNFHAIYHNSYLERL